MNQHPTLSEPLSSLSNRPVIRLVITDLDNTLYDWVTFFATSFYRMVEKAAAILGVSESELLDALQVVHRMHHNSEHPFALLETSLVRSRFPNADAKLLAAYFDEAFHEFNRARNESLRLYPGVRETLQHLHESRVKLVAHTEATVPNALLRLSKLQVAHFFQHLYAVEPPECDKAGLVMVDHSQLPPLDVVYLQQWERKPEPRVLFDICSDLQVPPAETLYVGDSISRDIGMAKEAGTWAAHARYGMDYDQLLWQKLVRITHWTQEDVERAQIAQQLYGHAKPDVVLERSFSEILDHFTFKSA